MTARAKSRTGNMAAIAGVLAMGAALAAQQPRAAAAPDLRTARPGGKTASTSAGDNAAVSGTVRDDAGKPAARALVMIAATDRGLIRTIAADAGGRFTIDALPAGHYLLAAGKATFIAAMYGAGRVSGAGEMIDLAPHERRRDVAIALARGAVIAGHVLDADGQPLPNVRVRVSQRREAAGEVTISGDLGDPVGAVTDDRGAFRIFDLEPGVYTVAAQPRSNPGAVRQGADGATRPVAYRPVYFPNATTAAASEAIVLSDGQVRDDVDLRTSLVTLARVSGVVTRDGAPDASGALQLSLRPSGSGAGAILGVLNTRGGADGRFTFANVPPGDYRVLARTVVAAPAAPGTPPGTPQYATANVTVRDRDVPDLSLALSPGATVSGRVEFEGLPGLPGDIGSVRISVRPTPASAVPSVPDPVTTDAHAGFTIAGLAPGKYRLFVQIPNNNVTQAPDWYEKGAAIDGADAFDVPFEVTPGRIVKDVTVLLTDDEQEIDGRVRGANASPIAGASVIVFPTDRRFWFQGSRRIVVRQADAEGAFVFGVSAALPVGEYFVAAAPAMALAPNDQFDAAVLDALSTSAARVSLGPNGNKSVDVAIKTP